MQHDSQQKDQNEEPVVVNTELIGVHEVSSEIHTLQIEKSESVHHGNLSVPEI